MTRRLSREELLLGDGKLRRDEVHAALLVVGLPLLVLIRITLFMRQRAGGDFTTVDTYALFQSVMVALTMGILLVTPRTQLVLRKLRGYSPGVLLLFYGVCAASMVWSLLPTYSLYRAVEVMVQMMAIWVALSYFRTFASLERAALLLTFLALMADFSGRVLSSGFGNLRTNTYSASAGMLFCYCFGEYARATGKRRRRMLLYMLVAAPCVMLGQCSTSNVALLGGALMVGLFQRGTVRVLTIVLLVVILMLVLTGLHEKIIDAAYGVVFPGKTREQVAGMSGRMGMWQWAMKKFSDKPLTGYGFLVLGRVERNALTMHNAIIGALVDTGILGGFLLGLTFLMTLLELLGRLSRMGAGLIGCIGAFTAGFINCMGVPFLSTQWTTATFAFSALFGLYLHGVLHRPYPAYPATVRKQGVEQTGARARTPDARPTRMRTSITQ